MFAHDGGYGTHCARTAPRPEFGYSSSRVYWLDDTPHPLRNTGRARGFASASPHESSTQPQMILHTQPHEICCSAWVAFLLFQMLPPQMSTLLLLSCRFVRVSCPVPSLPLSPTLAGTRFKCHRRPGILRRSDGPSSLVGTKRVLSIVAAAVDSEDMASCNRLAHRSS